MDNLNQVTWIRSLEKIVDQLPIYEQARFYKAIELLVRNGSDLGYPHVSHVRGKIWELRYQWNKKFVRVFYFNPDRGRFVLLNVVFKKENKTKNVVIETAERRMRIYQEQPRSHEWIMIKT